MQPVKQLNKEKPPHCGSGPLALLFHHWGLLLPPWATPPASASLLPKKWHLWPMERSGPQTPMEETNHLEHERGNTVSSQSPLSLQHILGCRKRENSSSVLLEPEDWWLWPPPLQATVRVSNSTWLGLFLSLWFSKENGQLNCFKLTSSFTFLICRIRLILYHGVIIFYNEMIYNSSSKALYALELKIIINGKEMFMLVWPKDQWGNVYLKR